MKRSCVWQSDARDREINVHVMRSITMTVMTI